MGRFDRYVLSQLLRVFAFFALVLVGIYWINRAVLLLDRYLSDGQGGGLVLQLALLTLPAILLIVLPVAGFVSSVYVTNRLHADSELVVVQTTGFSAQRLARPFLVFGLLLALLMSVLAHGVVPAAMGRVDALEARLTDAISSRLIVPGTFQTPTDGVTIYVRDVQPDGTLEGLLVHDRRDPVRETTYNANRALLVRHETGPRLLMFDGMAQSLVRESGRLSTTRFVDFTVGIGTLVAAPAQRRLDYRQLPTPVLLDPGEGVVEATQRSRAHLVREAHLRFAQAFLSVGAVVLGYAALMIGGFSRFGLSQQIVLAVLLVVLVKLIDNAAVDIARRTPGDWPFTYVSTGVSVAVCIALLALANSNLVGRLRRRRAP